MKWDEIQGGDARLAREALLRWYLMLPKDCQGILNSYEEASLSRVLELTGFSVSQETTKAKARAAEIQC